MSSSMAGLKLVQPQSIITRKLLLWMSIISLLAAICNVIADLILTYDPQGNYSSATPAPLTVALWRVLLGSFLGVFCIPFELAGYWVVCTVLSATAPRLFRVLFWVMAYAIIIGTVFHGTFLAVILVGQAAHSVAGAAQASLLQLQTTLLVFSTPLVGFFGVCYFVLWSIVIIQSCVPRRSIRNGSCCSSLPWAAS